tara:strand:- start:303 stop:566 length:264 start_codon:yes stop_codon:yes gene_type:complete
MIKIISMAVSVVLLAVFMYVMGQHSGHSVGKKHGLIEGCQQVVDIAVPTAYEPKCLLVQDELAVQLTNPEDGEVRTEILSTGEEVSE